MLELIPMESLAQGTGLGCAAVATWVFIRLAAKLGKLIDLAIEYLSALQGHHKRTEEHQERSEQLLTRIAMGRRDAHAEH